ncbi:MAG: formate/nitrite transporter [Blastococcus sp.]|nr:formate/nitrite transporter [Blastococcus sp.]
MPRSVVDTVHDVVGQAADKAAAARRPGAYLVSSVLAGCYVGMAIVLLISVSAPLAVAGSPVTKLVQGAVFGLALTLVVFAGAELFTGNVMVMAQGLRHRTVDLRSVLRVNSVSLAGNAVGSLALAAAVHAAGVLSSGGPASPGLALLSSMVEAKTHATGSQLFWRAVLCNALVCLALWMAARATTDGAKLLVLWWGLLAFIASGFEHSVANMTTFSLAVLHGRAEWPDLGNNLIWTIPGNVVGALLVALAYAWTTPRRATVAPPAPADLPTQRVAGLV